MTLLHKELESFDAEDSYEAGKKLLSFVSSDENVGDLISLDYDGATVLIHDALRQHVHGIPMGCFLLATRIRPDSQVDAEEEDAALILLRVIGKGNLSNNAETEKYRLDAGFRAIDTDENWDADKKTDQFTLNQLRHAGVRCDVLGTFRLSQDKDNAKWHLTYGSDISNFYSGQGMKVYKPMGERLACIVNHTNPTGRPHSLSGHPVEIGRVRYCSSEVTVDAERENVFVNMEPTDLLARRTALFGMSRSGKSNTIKTISSAIFKLRDINGTSGRVGQLIFDVNGEYCNDNPQDEGCLRNVWRTTKKHCEGDVVTYGMFPHPNDEERHLMKVNFFGEHVNINIKSDINEIKSKHAMLYVGKEIISDHFKDESALYVKSFLDTKLETLIDNNERGNLIRYQRCVAVYRAILAKAGFTSPDDMKTANIKGLFNKDLIEAMKKSEKPNYRWTANQFEKGELGWDVLFDVFSHLQKYKKENSFKEFNMNYMNQKGHSWDDDNLNGMLSLLSWESGVKRIRMLKERHSPDGGDYSKNITKELKNGKMVIVDQSVGSPAEIQYSSERIMKEIFEQQKEIFINPPRDAENNVITDDKGNILPPPDIIVYVEEAHNLLPAKNADLTTIWARIAKEGSKFRIGMVFSTQEPSSILSNILKNTDNWFVAHLNNQDETRELQKYYDFASFISQILKVSDTGFLRMRCLSNPYIVPVQVNKYIAPTE